MTRLIDADEIKQKACRAYGFSAGSSDQFEKGKASAFWEVAQWVDDMGTIYDDQMRFRLKERSEWLEDSDPGQEYGTTWACYRCKHSWHEPYIWNPKERKFNYCPWCGCKMEDGTVEKEIKNGTVCAH